jgi:hypothetical protein
MKVLTRWAMFATLAFSASHLAACQREDWGGPKGPPLATESSAGAMVPAQPKAPETEAPTDAGAPSVTSAYLPGPGTGAASGVQVATAIDSGSAESTGPSPRVDATMSGGKIPGFEDAVAGMRSTLKGCVEGKGKGDARVEITARVGPKGKVVRSDKVGGSSFAQGAVACLVKRIDAAQFKKPSEGTPTITFRVRMAAD